GSQCDAQSCAGPLPACACDQCPDSDGDGLSDAWEQAGGIDMDYDGDIDVALPGADPSVKDVYLEIDYMRGQNEGSPPPAAMSYRPTATAIARLETAFTQHGMRLHVDVDDVIPLWGTTD